MYSGSNTMAAAKYTCTALTNFGGFGLKLIRFGTAANPVTYSLRNGTTGAVIYTKQLFASGNSVGTGAWTTYSIVFTEAPIQLPAGIYYFCVEYAGTDASNCIGIGNVSGVTDAEVILWLFNGSWANSGETSSFTLSTGEKWTFA
jgi:hypothetical protein